MEKWKTAWKLWEYAGVISKCYQRCGLYRGCADSKLAGAWRSKDSLHITACFETGFQGLLLHAMAAEVVPYLERDA